MFDKEISSIEDSLRKDVQDVAAAVHELARAVREAGVAIGHGLAWMGVALVLGRIWHGGPGPAQSELSHKSPF